MWTIEIGITVTLFCFTLGFNDYMEHTAVIEPYRLLLLGKTGHGKSSLGNHLLGREAFKSSPSSNSVTQKGKKEAGSIGDTPIVVVDTPGVSDTVIDESQTALLIVEAATLSPEGYDAFLIVLNPNVRITPEEKHTIKLLRELFLERFFNYVIFVFTHKNGFEQRTSGINYNFNNYLNDLDDEMKTFLNKAWGRYVFLDTKERNMDQRRQTNIKFLEHLETINDSNEGERYTNLFFKSMAAFNFDCDKERTNEKEWLNCKRKKGKEVLHSLALVYPQFSW